MLELVGLTCSYGTVKAVDDMTLRVEPGRVCCLVGRNAAGKTTAMRAVVGLVNPTAGRVLWKGLPPSAADRKGFSYFPAQRGLYPQLLVRDQLVFLGRIHGMTTSAALAAGGAWLERVGMAHVGQRPLKSLSEGQQQRVQLAACLMHQPLLAVLDEPFALLDQESIGVLRAILRDLAGRGCTVLVSSNQLDVMEGVADDVAVLDAGRLVAHGAVDEIRARSGRRMEIRFATPPAPGWEAALADVEIHHDATRVTIRLGRGADRQTVMEAAEAVGPVVECWWGPCRLRDIYRDALKEQP